jgi:hypothetical protein
MENKLPKPIVNQSNIKKPNKKKNKLKVQSINNPRDKKKKKHCCCLKCPVSRPKYFSYGFQYFNGDAHKLI